MANSSKKRSRNVLMRALSGIAVAGSLMMPLAAEAGPRALVELFTSQGCSSCPPADAVLGELSKRDDIIALTLPVDYWDYLGWKDTLASPEYSRRQFNYAKKRGDRSVFTPQVVVNGRESVIGSNKGAINRAIDRQVQQSLDPEVDVVVRQIGNRVSVTVGGSADRTQHATVWLVLYNKEETVDIGRGENTGRKVTYHNVVRKIQSLAMWTGEEMTLDLPKSELARYGAEGCAVILQTGDGLLPGPILGASMMEGLQS
ncbi:DUF1223 domain-containing protein [Coralliovum pocilloporae]|uniref:DUF1223 domain-containing protein n=1 Tax=Coralliovum pocilloporae TaxID=3066369 RepID=UPI0033078148